MQHRFSIPYRKFCTDRDSELALTRLDTRRPALCTIPCEVPIARNCLHAGVTEHLADHREPFSER